MNFVIYFHGRTNILQLLDFNYTKYYMLWTYHTYFTPKGEAAFGYAQKIQQLLLLYSSPSFTIQLLKLSFSFIYNKQNLN